MRGGSCYACGVGGPAGRETDFLCGACADPRAATVVCANCRRRTRFDSDEGISLVASYFPEQAEIARGSVLRIEHCADCTDILPKRRTVRHFAIA